MKLQVGRSYRATNKNLDPDWTWSFHFIAKIRENDRDLYVGVKLGVNVGSTYTHVFDSVGNEVEPADEETPFKLYERSDRKPRFTVCTAEAS